MYFKKRRYVYIQLKCVLYIISQTHYYISCRKNNFFFHHTDKTINIKHSLNTKSAHASLDINFYA